MGEEDEEPRSVLQQSPREARRQRVGMDQTLLDQPVEPVAELGDAWKALHSHRAAAARALLEEVGNGPRGL